MGSVTLPNLPDSITYTRAKAIVADVAQNHPHRHAYPHARGNDWGVTISDPNESDDELYRHYASLLYLELI
jgi:hypothetical protein